MKLSTDLVTISPRISLRCLLELRQRSFQTLRVLVEGKSVETILFRAFELKSSGEGLLELAALRFGKGVDGWENEGGEELAKRGEGEGGEGFEDEGAAGRVFGGKWDWDVGGRSLLKRAEGRDVEFLSLGVGGSRGHGRRWKEGKKKVSSNR